MSWLLLLWACSSSQPTCEDNAWCAEGEACVDGDCQVVDCLESDDCAMGDYCHPVRYSCVAGCGTDADCTASQQCDTVAHECVEASCDDSHIDCAFGEQCDTGIGSCEAYDRALCEACDPDAPTACDDGAGYCLTIHGDAACYWICEVDADCPSGFDCMAQGEGREPACVADCAVAVEQGWLDE